jgi:hypothetical protein
MDFDARWEKNYVAHPQSAERVTATGAWFSTEQMAWVTVHRQFEALWYLQDGWDGDDARAPDDKLLAGVSELLAELQDGHAPAPSRILPILDGGILIEWTTPDRHLEIEIEEPYCGEIMDIREGAETEHYLFCWRKTGPGNDAEFSQWADIGDCHPGASSSFALMQT